MTLTCLGGFLLMETMGGDSPQQDTDSGRAVEFIYRPTAADFEEALRARARRSPAGRAQVLISPLIAIVAVSVCSILQDASLPVWIFTLGLSVAATSWGAVRGRRIAARRMFSFMESYGQCHVVADDRGAVTTGEGVSHTTDWRVFRDYLETPGLFVLLSGDRAAGFVVLPKRGAQGPADVDWLRAILDRNLKRL
ncbi:YcxB family protein [Streptomyces sp. NPDC002742]|uniref:YcxB family protein n=1 Tax=Streptomyces sp. NPDC002742 TaxID=3364663 RepID=UPI0036C95C73